MKITQKQIDYILDEYVTSRKSTYTIAKELGISDVTVGYYLKKNNIQVSNQKYKFDEHYFEKIDTENKAYFLGLIYADGCVYPLKNSLAIKLTEEDSYILKKLKEEVNSTKPLYKIKSQIIKGTDYIGKAQIKLELNSKILLENLKELGIVENKSLILKFPENIPEEFMKDFIRGYFDGDGCIYNSQNRIMLNFVGSEDFCKGLCSWLQENLDITITPKKDKRGNSWYLYILRIKDVIKFCEFIYQDENCLKLVRKFIKFKNYENRV